MPQEQLSREQVAVALMDLLDEASKADESYQLSKRRMRLLVAERFNFDKLRCTICRVWREKTDFCRNGAKSRGLDYECRECRARCGPIRGGRY